MLNLIYLGLYAQRGLVHSGIVDPHLNLHRLSHELEAHCFGHLPVDAWAEAMGDVVPVRRVLLL